MSVKIIGTGSALPEKCMTNTEISGLVETSDSWIRERTGIVQRHISTGETVAELATKACRKALLDGHREAEDIDMILVATCSPERGIPSVACQVQKNLGAKKAVAFDLNAACAGFLFALHTAWAYMETGICNNALVVGAEVLSKLVDWTDRGTCILFGDGAGAVLAERAQKGGILGFIQHSDGSRGDSLLCDSRAINNPYQNEVMEAPYVRMDGKAVFSFAVRQVPAGIEEVLKKAGLTADEVDLFVLHQANYRIIEGIAARLGQDLSKFPCNLDRVGNMSSAAIPVLLDELNTSGRIQEGMTLVLSGFGAGLTWGACAMKW